MTATWCDPWSLKSVIHAIVIGAISLWTNYRVCKWTNRPTELYMLAGKPAFSRLNSLLQHTNVSIAFISTSNHRSKAGTLYAITLYASAESTCMLSTASQNAHLCSNRQHAWGQQVDCISEREIVPTIDTTSKGTTMSQLGKLLCKQRGVSCLHVVKCDIGV